MANSYLSRTPSSAGNTSVWTASFWIKFSSFTNQDLFNAGTAGTNHGLIFLNGNQQLEAKHYAGSFNYQLVTNRRFRDCNAWYHIVVAYNDLESTSSDRIKIYVNGVQETSFATATYPSLDFNSKYNETTLHTIGRGIESGTSSTYRYFDGYMSHFAFVDGQALAPTVFGETDSTSGIWKFKPPSGVTWGTNGFHLKFENSGALGTDSAGSNNWTVNGNLKQALDTPSNVHATLNSLTNDGGGAKTYSNGNTTVVESADNWTTAHSTLSVTTGKWYYEAKVTYSNNQEAYLGACSQQTIQDRVNSSHYLGQTTGSVGYYTGNGSYYKGAGAVSYGSAVSGGDIVGVALDLDNNFIYFSINGTWQNSGNPASGASGTNGISLPSGMTSGDNIFLSVSPNQSTINCNFGNGFFGTTAITSAGSNGNGSLFEYDVPSGYYALNTKNINTYG